MTRRSRNFFQNGDGDELWYLCGSALFGRGGRTGIRSTRAACMALLLDLTGVLNASVEAGPRLDQVRRRELEESLRVGPIVEQPEWRG